MHQPKPDEMFWVWVEFGPAQAQTFDLNRKGSFDNMVKYMGDKRIAFAFPLQVFPLLPPTLSQIQSDESLSRRKLRISLSLFAFRV